ncbi:MAG: hypothetical protein MMC33_000045 [Icmadophila ericetorum]|nr:hypothetical protein [Icmadophila ericetorum]
MDESTTDGKDGFILGFQTLSMDFPEPGEFIDYQVLHGLVLGLQHASALDKKQVQRYNEFLSFKKRFQHAKATFMEIRHALLDMEISLMTNPHQSALMQLGETEDAEILQGGTMADGKGDRNLLDLELLTREIFTRSYRQMAKQNLFSDTALRLGGFLELCKRTTNTLVEKHQLKAHHESTQLGIKALVLRLTAWMDISGYQNDAFPLPIQYHNLYRLFQDIDMGRKLMQRFSPNESSWPIERFAIDMATAECHFSSLGLKMVKAAFLNGDIPVWRKLAFDLGLKAERFDGEPDMLPLFKAEGGGSD